VPVLARVIESLGIPTVTVTMMPDLAQKFRLSRIVGVEFPFGHSFGTPHNDELMLTVARAAAEALEEAGEPGYRLDVPAKWPVPDEIAYKTWHPPQPSPIVAQMLKSRPPQQR
jgi:hypothetical protein